MWKAVMEEVWKLKSLNHVLNVRAKWSVKYANENYEETVWHMHTGLVLKANLERWENKSTEYKCLSEESPPWK